MRYNLFKHQYVGTTRGKFMYKLFELFGTEWIDALQVKTLEEIKKRLLEESKKEGVSHFRIDRDDIPITFCHPEERDINYCIENLDRLEQAVMYMHNSHKDSFQRVESSRPSQYKEEIKKPKKTTKKHQKKLAHSNNRKRRDYR